MSEIQDPLPLYLENPVSRFSARAREYAQYRPSYPPEAIAHILSELGDLNTIVAADIGAGTGISASLLAARGVRVLAVEPNVAMKQMAISHPQVQWLEGTAETIPLADKSVDLVTVFQAFHWFHLEPALKEFSRILKPNGRVAIVWNHRDRNDQFTQAYSQIFKQASRYNSAMRPRSRRPITSLLESLDFENQRHQKFTHHQALDLTGLIGRTHSASYIPKQGLEAESILRNIRELYHNWKDNRGFVYILYRTDVYLAELKVK